MTVEADVAEELSRQKAEDRIKAARDALLAEQDAHRKTIAAEAEKSKSELEIYLSDLKPDQQRLLRMHAYLTFMTADWAEASNRQAGVDLITLRLAKYMITGEAT